MVIWFLVDFWNLWLFVWGIEFDLDVICDIKFVGKFIIKGKNILVYKVFNYYI